MVAKKAMPSPSPIGLAATPVCAPTASPAATSAAAMSRCGRQLRAALRLTNEKIGMGDSILPNWVLDWASVRECPLSPCRPLQDSSGVEGRAVCERSRCSEREPHTGNGDPEQLTDSQVMAEW